MNRTYQFFFVAGVLLLMAGGFWWYGSQMERLVCEQNHISGRLLVDQAMLARHWAAIKEREQLQVLVAEVSKQLSKQTNSVEIIRPHASTGVVTPKDEFERNLCARYLAYKPVQKVDVSPPEFSERFLPEKDEYQYYQPVRAEQSCLLKCHNLPVGKVDTDAIANDLGAAHPSEGDLMGIVKVTLPAQPIRQAIQRNRAVLCVVVLTVALAIVAAFILLTWLHATLRRRSASSLSDVKEAP